MQLIVARTNKYAFSAQTVSGLKPPSSSKELDWPAVLRPPRIRPSGKWIIELPAAAVSGDASPPMPRTGGVGPRLDCQNQLHCGAGRKHEASDVRRTPVERANNSHWLCQAPIKGVLSGSAELSEAILALALKTGQWG